MTPPLSCASHMTVQGCCRRGAVADGGEVVPASVTVEGGGSGSDLQYQTFH